MRRMAFLVAVLALAVGSSMTAYAEGETYFSFSFTSHDIHAVGWLEGTPLPDDSLWYIEGVRAFSILQGQINVWGEPDTAQIGANPDGLFRTGSGELVPCSPYAHYCRFAGWNVFSDVLYLPALSYPQSGVESEFLFTLNTPGGTGPDPYAELDALFGLIEIDGEYPDLATFEVEGNLNIKTAPEPSTVLLFLSGSLCLAMLMRCHFAIRKRHLNSRTPLAKDAELC